MVENYRLLILKSAQKDKEKIKQVPTLKRNADNLLSIIQVNPYQNPPPYERLLGIYKDCFSRRLNRQHRLVYKVDDVEKVITIISLWTHYENI